MKQEMKIRYNSRTFIHKSLYLREMGGQIAEWSKSSLRSWSGPRGREFKSRRRQKFINLFNYLFDFICFFQPSVSHKDLSTLCEKARNDEDSWIGIQSLCGINCIHPNTNPRGLMRKSGLISGWMQGDTIYLYIQALGGSCESQDLYVEEKWCLRKSLRGMRKDGSVRFEID